MTPVDLLASASAAVVAALAWRAAREARAQGRKWIALTVLTFVLLLETFTIGFTTMFEPIRIVRDAVCAWVLIELGRSRAKKEPQK